MLTLTYAETDALYMSWTYPGIPDGAARLHPNALTGIPQLIRQLVPEPLEGETQAEAIERAKLVDWQPLLTQLANALIPQHLHELIVDSPRKRLTIHPSPALAQVPWALLTVGGQPLCAYMDVAIGVPRPVTTTPRTPAGTGRALIIDPKVPGHRPNSPLGSVLGPVLIDDPLSPLLGPDTLPPANTLEELVRRDDQNRDWLREVSATANSLLFAGHVSASTSDGSTTAMHLCCTDESGKHLPLNVAHVFHDEQMVFPPRVAFVACASGSDMGLYEPLGWVTTAIYKGASFVVGSAWSIPTDVSFEGEYPLREVIVAMNSVINADDPVRAFNEWKLECWNTSRPHVVVWGSLMGFVA